MNGIATAFTATIVKPAECLAGHTTGTRYLKLRAAVDGRDDHNRHYLDILVFGDDATAELAHTLGRGVELYVEGRLRLDPWTTRDGEPRIAVSIIARRIEPLGRFGRGRAQLAASDRRHAAEMASLRARLEAMQGGEPNETPADGIDNEQIPF